MVTWIRRSEMLSWESLGQDQAVSWLLLICWWVSIVIELKLICLMWVIVTWVSPSCWQSPRPCHAMLWTCLTAASYYIIQQNWDTLTSRLEVCCSVLCLCFTGSWHWCAASIVGYKLRSANQSWKLYSQVSSIFEFQFWNLTLSIFKPPLLSCII